MRRSPYFAIAVTLVAVRALAVGTSWAAAKAIEVPLWPGPGVERDKRVKSIEDSPCGDLAYAKVSKLPAPDSNGPLRSELVVELSDRGTVLKTWPKPVDYGVSGIIGDQLVLTPYGEPNGVILVTTTGEMTPAKPPSNLTPEINFACPAISAFGKSAYVGCWKFKDAKTGSTRSLAYEGPCT